MGLTKETLKHTTIYGISTVFGKFVSFFMLPFYAHLFGSEGYGVIGILDASIGVLGVIFAAGFHTAIVRVYHGVSIEKKGIVITTGIRLVWVLGLLMLPIPLLASKNISYVLFGDSKYYLIVILSLITFVISVTGQSACTYIIIKQRSGIYSIVRLASVVIGLILNVWLVLILRVGIIGIFISSFVMATSECILYHILVRKEFAFIYNREIAKKISDFQLPLIPGDLVSFFSRQSERFLVRYIINLRMVGILEMAYKFPPLLNLFISLPFIRVWRTKSIEIAEQKEAPEIMSRMFTNYIFLMTFAGLLLAVNLKAIITILTPPEFLPAVSIGRIEILTSILAGSNTIMVFGLIYREKTKTISLIKTIISVFKIGVSALMILSYGIKGAAYSALIMEGFLLIWITKKSQESYYIHFEFKKLLLISASGLALFFMVSEVDYMKYVPTEYFNDSLFPAIIDIFRKSPISTWNSGKIFIFIQTSGDIFYKMIFDTLFACLFLTFLPLVYHFKKLEKIYNIK